MTYATDRLYEEVAYVAYHFHWSLDEILDLEHPVRQRFVAEIAKINRRLSEERSDAAMGLLSRWRPASAGDTTPVETPTASEVAPPQERDVIRASDLLRVPEWQKVPPMASSLPPMPVIVSQHFDDSLVSWQPPQRFIGDLGHAITDTALLGS